METQKLKLDILETSPIGTKTKPKQNNHTMNTTKMALIQIGFSSTQKQAKKSSGVTLCTMNRNLEIALFTKKSKNNRELLRKKRKWLKKP